MAEVTEGLVYRGHPLRRVDNLIYYGSMADKYIVMMQVLDTAPLKDITLAKRVSIQLQMTDASLRSRDRVVRSTEKSSLGEAMEFASIWLERALSGKMYIKPPRSPYSFTKGSLSYAKSFTMRIIPAFGSAFRQPARTALFGAGRL